MSEIGPSPLERAQTEYVEQLWRNINLQPTPEQAQYFRDLAARHVPYDPSATIGAPRKLIPARALQTRADL